MQRAEEGDGKVPRGYVTTQVPIEAHSPLRKTLPSERQEGHGHPRRVGLRATRRRTDWPPGWCRAQHFNTTGFHSLRDTPEKADADDTTLPYDRKYRGTKEPVDEGEKGE